MIIGAQIKGFTFKSFLAEIWKVKCLASQKKVTIYWNISNFDLLIARKINNFQFQIEKINFKILAKK